MSSAQLVNTPRRLGSYEVVREVAQGGMGVVYLARQPALDRLIVIKRMRRELLGDHGMVERFQREARSASAIHHHNVVAVYDCFTLRGDHYIAQEFVEGVDLLEILERVGRLPGRIAALVALEVARGLEEIHARGIVHRDLKPANILIGLGGEVKIADFGVALSGTDAGLTRPGTMLGSLPYMSPEQMLGERVDHRSDLFSFGVVGYESVVGETPFEIPDEDSADTLLERIRQGRYVPPRHLVALPRYLGRCIRDCLRARPSRRRSSITAVRRALEAGTGRPSNLEVRQEIAAFLFDCGMTGVDEERTAVRPVAVASPRRRRRARLAAATAAGTLVLAAAAGMVYRGAGGEPIVEATPAPLAEPAVPAPYRPEAAPAAALVAANARLRVVAVPWARVTVDDDPPFHTPRAEHVGLVAGTHTIRLEHPTLGRADLTVDLDENEERTLHHDFHRGESR